MGIDNPSGHNNCFMTAILQMLSATPLLVQALRFKLDVPTSTTKLTYQQQLQQQQFDPNILCRRQLEVILSILNGNEPSGKENKPLLRGPRPYPGAIYMRTRRGENFPK